MEYRPQFFPLICTCWWLSKFFFEDDLADQRWIYGKLWQNLFCRPVLIRMSCPLCFILVALEDCEGEFSMADSITECTTSTAAAIRQFGRMRHNDVTRNVPVLWPSPHFQSRFLPFISAIRTGLIMSCNNLCVHAICSYVYLHTMRNESGLVGPWLIGNVFLPSLCDNIPKQMHVNLHEFPWGIIYLPNSYRYPCLWTSAIKWRFTLSSGAGGCTMYMSTGLHIQKEIKKNWNCVALYTAGSTAGSTAGAVRMLVFPHAVTSVASLHIQQEKLITGKTK